MDFHELLHAELILRKRRRVMRRLGAALGVPSAIVDRAAIQANAETIAGVVRDPAFRADCRWIASKLGIPLDEVQVALHEVVRSGRVVMRSHQRWEAANG